MISPSNMCAMRTPNTSSERRTTADVSAPMRFMAAAHSLYRSVGFQEIEQYPESEIPEEFRQHWIFMELPL